MPDKRSQSRRQFLSAAAAGSAIVLAPRISAARGAKPVVIDLSDATIVRAGLAGATVPKLLAASATPRSLSTDTVEKLLRSAFLELRAGAGRQPLILIDAPDYSRASRAALAAAAKKLGVTKLHITDAATAAVRATKRTTGLVCFVCESGSFAAPVVDGKLIRGGVKRAGASGRDLTEYLRKQMQSRGHQLDYATARRLRDSVGEVARDYSAKVKNPGTRSFSHGGHSFTVGAERFRCPEVLFSPRIAGKGGIGIHTAVHRAAGAAPSGSRGSLYANTVMSGGTTMFPGVAERMQDEIKMVAPDSMTIKIIAPPKRADAAFQGGTNLAGLSAFEEMLVGPAEYDEAGPGIAEPIRTAQRETPSRFTKLVLGAK